jgi:hypothetical protein
LSGIFEVDGMAANGFHALNEKDRRESATRNLVRDVPVVLLNADSPELFCQICVAQIPTFQLGLEQPFDERLPVLDSGRHADSPNLMTKPPYTMVLSLAMTIGPFFPLPIFSFPSGKTVRDSTPLSIRTVREVAAVKFAGFKIRE